jgi:hypothetical protein
MTDKRLLLAGAVLAGLSLLAWSRPDPAPTSSDAPATDGLVYAPVEARAFDELAFGPDGILFAGDALGGTLYALDVADNVRDTSTAAFEIPDIETMLAARLGTTTDAMRIYDMAVHPVSQRVYLAVARGPEAAPVLLRVSRAGGIEEVALDHIRHSRALLPNLPGPDDKTRWGEPVRTYSITDLAYADGQVLVAGLSNEEFASTLRRVPYPFGGDGGATGLEIYHAAHGRYETHAPIEAFLPFTLGGAPHIIASYGCTPLATFPLAEMKAGGQLRGKTVGELGGGNRPLDMIAYEKEGKPYILIANSNRTLMRLDPADIAQAGALSTPVGAAYLTAGVPYVSIAQVGVLHVADLNANFVAGLRRDVYTGKLDLVSLPKRWL